VLTSELSFFRDTELGFTDPEIRDVVKKNLQGKDEIKIENLVIS
jgi:hypothetical protein